VAGRVGRAFALSRALSRWGVCGRRAAVFDVGWRGLLDDGFSFNLKKEVSSEAAKTNITVSVSENDGEPFPLVYVVICTPLSQ
jgi:hypothetical protein